jgi:signal peptidase I
VSSASAPEASAPLAPEEERKLRKLLKQRDKDEEKRLRKEVLELEPGSPCPVCADEGKGPGLEPTRFPAQLEPLLRRKGFACSECGLKAQPAPNSLGYVLALAVAISCALGGMTSIFAAQRMDDPSQRLYTFVAGAVLFAGGLFLGQGAQGAGSSVMLAQKVARGRRRRQADGKHGKDKKSKQAREKAKKKAAAEAEQAWAAENLEAVVVAIILALIIRHFAMEAFVIPTGSMAPTLFGDHFRVECPNCGYGFSRGKSDSDFRDQRRITVTSDCPVCDTEFPLERARTDVTDGDKILVNKFAYAFGEPERYDVVVFKYPLEPWKNFIKRLVGLPGETIEIRNGDVYADGVLQRKPDHVQDATWLPVYDARFPRRDAATHPFWQVRDDLAGTGTWATEDEGALVCTPAGDVGPWLEHEPRRILRDHYGYNGYRPYDGEPIADLRLRTVVTAAQGAARLAIREDERILAVHFPVGEGQRTYQVTVDGQPVHEEPGPALPPGAPTPIGIAYADDRLRVFVAGETRFEWVDTSPPDYTSNVGTVLLGAGGGEATFAHTQIDRDIYYVASGGRYDPSQMSVQVPDDSFFCMGDNSPNSEDGRKWGFVNQRHMVGRAFMVFWPLVPFQVKLIR